MRVCLSCLSCLILLGACAESPNTQMASQEQACRVTESRIGTNRLSTHCGRTSETDRDKAREAAEAFKDEMNRAEMPRPAGGMR